MNQQLIDDITKVLKTLSDMDLSSLLQQLNDNFSESQPLVQSETQGEDQISEQPSQDSPLQESNDKVKEYVLQDGSEPLNEVIHNDAPADQVEEPVPDELNPVQIVNDSQESVTDEIKAEDKLDVSHLAQELVDMQSQIYDAVAKRIVHDVFIIGGKSLTLDASINDMSDLWFSNVYIARTLSLNTVTEYLEYNELSKLESIVTANVWSRQKWPINQTHLHHLLTDFDAKTLYDWGFDELNEIADELGHQQLNILNVIDELCDLASPTIALQAINGATLNDSSDLKVNPNLASMLTIMMHLNALKAGARLMIEKLTDNKVTYQQAKAYVPNFISAYLFFTYYRTKKISQGHLLYLSRLISMLFSMIVNRHVIVEIK